MRVCSFCGENNEDWMNICQRCGNSIVNADVHEEPEVKVVYSSRNKRQAAPVVTNNVEVQVKETKKTVKVEKERKPIENLDLKIILAILLIILIVLIIYTISTFL